MNQEGQEQDNETSSNKVKKDLLPANNFQNISFPGNCDRNMILFMKLDIEVPFL